MVRKIHTKGAKSGWCFVGQFVFPDTKDGKKEVDTSLYNVNFQHMVDAPDVH